MQPEPLSTLQNESRRVRRAVVEMAFSAGSGHCGGSLSCVDILVTLFRRHLAIRPEQPDWEDRDRFVLSKGHAAPALYAMLARLGFFSTDCLLSLRRLGSTLQGHPDMRKVPGVEISTGSLGMGISNGIGMAWSARHKRLSYKTFVLVGDGELDEGQNWEAAMLAAKLGLDNLTFVVDANGVQLDGPTDEIMPLGDLAEKFHAFGWKTAACDGHDHADIKKALDRSLINEARRAAAPTAVIAKTVKGKGVSFMEGKHVWHGAPLTEELYRRAIDELDVDDFDVEGETDRSFCTKTAKERCRT